MSQEQRQFKHWANLNDEGKKLYGEIWEDGTVPVVSMIPTWFNIEGQDEQCYLIHHEEMTLEQINIMLDLLANRFGAPKSTIEEEMKKNRLPLRGKLWEVLAQITWDYSCPIFSMKRMNMVIMKTRNGRFLTKLLSEMTNHESG